MSRLTPLASIVATLLLAISGAATADNARISLAAGGALILALPDGWRTGTEAGPVPTLSLSSASGPRFQVLVSPLVSADGRVGTSSADGLRKLVASGATSARSQSVETVIPIQELNEKNVQGTYFSATDRAPKPGEFKYMTQGALLVQGLPVTFTILTNDNSRSAESVALRMLRSARKE